MVGIFARLIVVVATVVDVGEFKGDSRKWQKEERTRVGGLRAGAVR